MARRTSTPAAAFCGGGPADGERRPVEDGVTSVVVDESPPIEPYEADGTALRARGHLYERQPDGRFRYAGVVDRSTPEVAPVPVDPHEQALAALGHDRGPSFAAITLVILGLCIAMAFFAEYA